MKKSDHSQKGAHRAPARPKNRPAAGAGNPLALSVADVPSPLGPIVIVGDARTVYLVEFRDCRHLDAQFDSLGRILRATLTPGSSPAIARMATELAAYFASGKGQFRTPVRFPGTPFQERVWAALRHIPSGQTLTYGQLAARIDHPTAARAVARALGQNRLAIVLPCHRIIGSNGHLTGYAAGLPRKHALLALENQNQATRKN